MNSEQKARLERAKNTVAEKLRGQDPPVADWLAAADVRRWSRSQQGDSDDAPVQLMFSVPGSLNPNSALVLDLADSELLLLETDEAFLAERLQTLVEQARADNRLPVRRAEDNG